MSELRELHGKKMYGYGSGILGQLLPSTLINAYIFQFYVYTVGIDAFYVSIGTALAAMFNAIGSPIFGYLSDMKKPSKYGKRRLFLLYGLPILIFALIFIWIPIIPNPEESPWCAILYLWFMNISFFLGFSIIRSPYLAMLPELSQSDTNRIKISSFQGILSVLASVLGIVLPMLLQAQLTDPRNARYDTQDGLFLLNSLPIIGIGFASIAIFFTFLTFFSCDESHQLMQESRSEKKSLKNVLIQIFQPFKDRTFRQFLFSALCLNAGVRIMVKILAPFFTYVLFFQGNNFILFTFATIPFAVIGFILWTKRAKLLGLKKTFQQSNALIAIFLIAILVFLIPMDFNVRFIIAYILVSMIIFNLVAGYILPSPIVSALIDVAKNAQSPEQTNNISGAYFGAYLFMLNIANAVGDLLVGGLLTGSNAENPVFITLIFPIAGILNILALIFIWKANIPQGKRKK